MSLFLFIDVGDDDMREMETDELYSDLDCFSDELFWRVE
jgi:hypothetical protein